MAGLEPVRVSRSASVSGGGALTRRARLNTPPLAGLRSLPDDEDEDDEEEEEEGEEVSMEDRRLKKEPPFFPEGLDVLECLADLRCLILS